MWNYALFDLDGTLTDPETGITRSVQYALRAFGIEVTDLKSLRPFIGPPLRQSFRDFYGFSEEQAEEAVVRYREYYRVTGIFENEVYAGIPELLQKLKQQGITVIAATSKPTVFAQQIFEHFQLAQYFDFVSGCGLDGTRDTKAEVIEYALESCHINTQDAVMIGDRNYDIEGAKSAGLVSIGVLWGFGSRQELTDAGADYIAASVKDLTELIL